jgi:Zn-dependent peptidase ImmA (M78 family)
MLSSEAIERRAWELLAKAKVRKPRVDVLAIAELLGAQIKEVRAADDISGAIIREGDKINIGVNARHSENRRRFTVAHEIGHLVLHDAEAQIDHGYAQRHAGLRVTAFRDQKSSAAIDDKEIEANRYAAALLMPVPFLKNSLRSRTQPVREIDLLDLAAEYGVSAQAMSFRLMNVGIAVDVAG